jgi:SAM-dependent methyltransferase
MATWPIIGSGGRLARRVVQAVKPLEDIILICDEPEEGSEATLGTVVSGWAYSPSGIREISVWLDGQKVVGQTEYGLLRDDVAQNRPEWPNVLRCGFRYRFETLPAASESVELTVVAEDGEGRRTEVRRVVRSVNQLLVCDEPGEGSEVSLGTAVSGWAYSPAGIREISVWLDGRRMGEATHGLARQDVAQANPEWPEAQRSGFRYRLDAAPAPPLPRTAELTIVAEDGDGGRVEERRAVRVVEPPPLPMAGSLDIPKRRDPGDPLKVLGWSSPLVVIGWAVDPEGVDRIDVLLDGEVVAQAEHGFPREDVEGQQLHYRRLGVTERSGWTAVIPTDGFSPGEHTLTATVHGRTGTLPLGPTTIWLRADIVRDDATRQRRLEALLRCPKCHQRVVRGAGGLICEECGRAILTNEFGTLIADETYAGLDWRQAGATNHGYPPEAVELILGCEDGLVLDIGAGLRENLPHVIQLDALAYPNTDVVADAEALPFADESFDGVVACNLLEHVNVPANVIREMRRVCKVGGQIYADFTSVHPYHGFPHHYFNATETGLEWLMREVGGADGTVTAADGKETVRMVLEAWLGSLEDPVAREVVAGMSADELVTFLARPRQNPELHAALGNVFANGRRLIPPKVAFTGARMR